MQMEVVLEQGKWQSLFSVCGCSSPVWVWQSLFPVCGCGSPYSLCMGVAVPIPCVWVWQSLFPVYGCGSPYSLCVGVAIHLPMPCEVFNFPSRSSNRDKIKVY